ncbi:hypothetical protein [uncultured Lacinutrix sp.]|uniref:hypothetical protein n=1 Tax=uncultured Lacinutrix sp. TaxID=574032 RepID=UPI00263231A2|nr:hypothetical protein [uncultured Lacinutrix sp.]
MINTIRTSKVTKVISCYLAFQMILTMVQPSSLYALTSGPSQPEFNSFTPIGTSDMVNLSSGDFNYNIPIMDVGGYPINLAYDAGITTDQEASWVGLGWNLNVGQINRQVRGLPDDFDGDEIVYKDNLKDNKTVGFTFNFNPQFIGLGDISEATESTPADTSNVGIGGKFGLTIQHNNYTGVSFQPSYGISFDLTKNVSVGADLSSSASNGANISPRGSISHQLQGKKGEFILGLSAGVGIGYNSRQGLSNFNVNAGLTMFDPAKANELTSYINTLTKKNSGSINFVNNTFTPVKRAAFHNSSISFAASLGLDAWGIDAEVGVTGSASSQKLKNKERTANAFGYNNTHHANTNAVLDFNREKEEIITKNSLLLPATNYTYDIYQINGQGTSGMFRPFRGQVGHVYNQLVQDESSSDSFGGEYEGGAGWHVGLDYKNVTIDSRTGKWQAPVTGYFAENNTANNIDFESIYYKTIGEFTVDRDANIFTNQLGGNNPVRIGISAGNNMPGKTAQNRYLVKGEQNSGDPADYEPVPFNQQIKRSQRELRNTAIIPISAKEAAVDPLITRNSNSKLHHIAGYKTLNADGATYVYGETAYNIEKHENTFAVANNPNDVKNGLVTINGNENSNGNSSGVDHYFNGIETPEYAHTYLLSSVLSSDYEDLTGDGLSDDDLGAYTKFNYFTHDHAFNWRTPFSNNQASYNAGLNTDTRDQKGSVISGKKEVKYIQTIETKTHIAYFKLKERLDGKGANGSTLQAIDKIYLFSKPEFKPFQTLINNNQPLDFNELQAKAIKVAHFDYDYILTPETPNSSAISNDELINGGKLTLTKLYFTYRDSFMGKYSPYKFNYDNENPEYSLKANDIWGNYKENKATSYNVSDPEMSPQEYPFVQQESRSDQNKNAATWSLSSIELPSGGKIDISYETDDYQYVQDRKAMRMFKVVGVTKEDDIPSFNDVYNNRLYKNNNYNEDARYLLVEIPESDAITNSDFISRYIGDQVDKAIYFRFLLNMTKNASPSNSNNFDYVTGYFKINQDLLYDASTNLTFAENGKVYGAIPMAFLDLDGGINSNRNVNPISKAGWYFGRKHLPKEVYGLPPYTSGSVKDIVTQLSNDFGAITELITGANGKLRNEKLIAKTYVPNKSWIRLLEPTGTKLGGGLRVSKIEMHDAWDEMLNTSNSIYKQSYGQEYKYTLDDGTSSGVATYEPNSSKENPFVEPFYNQIPDENGIVAGNEKLVSPKEFNYVEKPFGESFFPSPTVTYSKVTVKNLAREDGDRVVKKHATGTVINDFYTSKDFPTIVDYTDLDGPDNYYSNDNDIDTLLGLDIDVTTELTLSQGFVVQTNDMNGKQEKQSVYNEPGNLISSVEYKYNINETTGQLDNRIPLINEDGSIIPISSNSPEVGMHYEVINDFNESYTYTNTSGFQGNIAVIPFAIFPIIFPMIVPLSSQHTNTLHTVATTKVIHRTGIQTEKIAYDLGATVSTKNIAWNADTGNVIVTKTSNEYNDYYYNVNFPAYWANDAMGLASNNISMQGLLNKENADTYTYNSDNSNIEDIFMEGDELIAFDSSIQYPSSNDFLKLWVVERDLSTNRIKLMDAEGKIIGDETGGLDEYNFKITRSGYRNMQIASMASITLMHNPITDGVLNEADFLLDNETQNTSNDPKIVNASAVEYSDFWNSQCEANIIKPMFSKDPITGEAIYDIDKLCLNPYIYNIKGDYRAKKSYAFLTGRYTTDQTAIKNQGFFNNFIPYYVYDALSKKWVSQNDNNKWTFASEVTQFSPYGAELENKDALNRFSSAQYGYEYTLPIAVSSNSQYKEMGFDGFEDYNNTQQDTHFGYHDQGADITDQKAHSGRNSIRVAPNSTIKLNKSVQDCSQETSNEN